MPNDAIDSTIEEFRANAGRLSGPFENRRMLLLTTRGAGEPRTTPVEYLPDTSDRVLVVAAVGGSPEHPGWYHDLLTDPRARVEDGVFSYDAEAVVLEGDEHDQAYARAVETDPGWADPEARTDREIRVVALRRTGNDQPTTSSMGAALVAIHDLFRRELALIRREVTTSGRSTLGSQLRINCLSVCQGLHFHHTAEDDGMFPGIAAEHPELASTIERLRREHETIAALLAELQAVVLDGEAESSVVVAEVERLTEALERHLDYEEEHLVPILDGMGSAGS